MTTSNPLRRRATPLTVACTRGLSLFALAGGPLLATTAPAAADIVVRFVESAPKDRFVVEQIGACTTPPLELVIDLSPAGLIFDTTAAGAGVEVFQPFEVVEGAEVLTASLAPQDGDQAVSLSFAALPPGTTFAFTVDVDDTNEASALGQIRVADSEIVGARVSADGADAVFTGDATARLALPCT